MRDTENERVKNPKSQKRRTDFGLTKDNASKEDGARTDQSSDVSNSRYNSEVYRKRRWEVDEE